MSAFADLTSIRDGAWELPDGWLQGRGVWGGLIVATAVRAALAADVRDGEGTSPRVVRDISTQMLGPVPAGQHPVAVAAVRLGSGTSTWRVEVLGDGETLASSTVVLGQRRSGEQPEMAHDDIIMPGSPLWRDVPVVPLGAPVAPEFLQMIELRPLQGFPGAGARDDVLSWVRLPDEPVYDAPLLLGLIDTLWPATLVTLTQMRPMATLTFAASLLIDPASIPTGEPLLHRGRLISVRDGYATETRELWTADGRLAVFNTQVMAIIR